jgi:hypothetical protein
MLASATSWEIYPWVQERQSNYVIGAVLSIAALILFAALAAPISNQHEFGSAPDGAGDLRSLLAVIAALFVIPSYLSILPWTDAKQSKEDTMSTRNQFNEWLDILTNKNSVAMRWMLINRFFYATRNTMIISSISFYLVYVRNLPTDELGTGVALVTLVGLFSGLLGMF